MSLQYNVISLSLSIYIYIYTQTCVYAYIYIYIYISLYIYIYTYICITRLLEPQRRVHREHAAHGLAHDEVGPACNTNDCNLTYTY